jgi:hypothetical protein
MLVIILIVAVIVLVGGFGLFNQRKGGDSQTAAQDRPPQAPAKPERRTPGLD